jgi:uncharacterized membrane protein YfcA
MQPEMTTVYIVAGIAALIIGLGKGGVGGTISVLAVPLLSAVLPVQAVVGLTLPLLIVADVFAVSAYWNQWDSHLIRKLLPGALVGIMLGTFVLVSTPPVLLRRGLGVFVVAFAIYKLFFERRLAEQLAYKHQDWHAWLAGAASGITSTVAHAGGAPVTVYLLFQRITPRAFVATSALFFAVVNLIKVPFYLFNGVFPIDIMLSLIWIVPIIPAGVWLGKLLTSRVDGPTFEKIILVLLVLSSLLLFI